MVSSGPFSNPEYDSGWIPLDPGGTYTLSHGCGVHFFAYIIGWDNSGENGYVIHQNYHGSMFWGAGDVSSYGIIWYSSDIDKITIHRDSKDVVYDEFRVFIWGLDSIYT